MLTSLLAELYGLFLGDTAGHRLVMAGSIALLAALAFTPLVILGARRFGWLDWPATDRWHSTPVALMGGIALFGAIVTGVVATGLLEVYAWPVWLAIMLVFASGLADDLLDIRPEAKLVVQIIATSLLLYAGFAFWRGAPFWVHIPLTFLWVVGVTNAVNLIDGMDGLAAGLTAVATAVLAAIAWLVGVPGVAAVSVVVMGATIGFLVFNFKPARVFMGDCGSLLLGFVLATLALTVQGMGEPLAATLVPVAVLAVPIFDTSFVTITRILNDRPITEGGNDHTMHRLVLLGLSERQTVLLLWSIAAIFAGGALMLYWVTTPLFIALMLFAGAGFVLLGLYLAGATHYPRIDIPLRVERKTASQKFGAVMQAVAGGAYWKSIVGTMADLLLVGAALVLAFHLRFDGAPPAPYDELMLRILPAVMTVKVAVFYLFGLYHGIWRHAGTSEFVRLVMGSTAASALLAAGMLLLGYGATLSPALVILDWMVTTAAIAGIRFGFRGMRQYLAAQRSNGTRVLIYGSDSASVLALRHLREDNTLHRTAVGFVDADDRRVGMHVQGLSVVGTPKELASISRAYDADELIVPTFSTDRDTQRELLRICVEAGIACRLFALDLHPAAPVQLQAPTGDGMTGKEGQAATTHDASASDTDEAASSSESSS